MTRSSIRPVASYVVSGIGPYAINWPYEAGSVTAMVMNGGVLAVIDPISITLDPVRSDTGGNLYLRVIEAELHDDKTIVLFRNTTISQGWLGTLGEREKGMEAQLDRETMALQDLSLAMTGALRVPGGTLPPLEMVPGGILQVNSQGSAVKTVTPNSLLGNVGLTFGQSSRVYPSLIDLVNDPALQVGHTCGTLGYYTSSDFGAAVYDITTVAILGHAPNGYNEKLCANGLVAVLQQTSNVFLVEQYGATSGGERSGAIMACNAAAIAYVTANGGAVDIEGAPKCDIKNRITLGAPGDKCVNVHLSAAEFNLVAGGNLTPTTAAVTIKSRRAVINCPSSIIGNKVSSGIDLVDCLRCLVQAPFVTRFASAEGSFGIRQIGETSGNCVILHGGGNEWVPGDPEFNARPSAFKGSTLVIDTADTNVIGGNYGWAKRNIYIGPNSVNTQFLLTHPFNGNPQAANPIVLLIEGQSNVGLNAGSTSGSKIIVPGVFVWNGDDTGSGTAFIPAEFGTAPYNQGADPWANNVGVHAANELVRLTGRNVYIIQKARGGRPIEAFLKPSTLAANGWTAPAPSGSLVPSMYPDIANAIAAVPGYDSTTVTAMIWQQGEGNDGDIETQYASKVLALIGDHTAEGIIDPENTPISVGGLIPPHPFNATFEAAVRRAMRSYGNLCFTESDGLGSLPDVLHFTGESLVALGLRHAATLNPILTPLLAEAGGGLPRDNPICIESDAKGKVYLNSVYLDCGYLVDNTARVIVRGGRHLYVPQRTQMERPYTRIKWQSRDLDNATSITDFDSSIGFFKDTWDVLDPDMAFLNSDLANQRGQGKTVKVYRREYEIITEAGAAPTRTVVKKGGDDTAYVVRVKIEGLPPLDMAIRGTDLRLISPGEDARLLFGSKLVGIGRTDFGGEALQFYSNDQRQFTLSTAGNLIPDRDGEQTMGKADFRLATIYATTGTINTSDRTLKTDIVEVSATEKAVAQALRLLVRRFRYVGGARLHIGIIAQDVQDTFAAHGLDAADYGLFCADEMPDGSMRLGIRYDELHSFLLAAL